MNRNEAQSEIIGVILILGVTFASIAVILLLGQPILSDATDSATVDRVQNEMITLDSRLTAASVGTSVNETLTFNLQGGSLTSEPDATRFNVTLENGDTIYNRSIGKIEYENGETAVAYEAGGIWRRNTLTDGSFMVSSPDFTFDGETLSLPVYNVTSEGGYSGPNTLSVRGGNRTNYYPNATVSNPVDGNVTVTVETEYQDGWARYFENQLRGNATVNEAENKVTAELLALETPNEIDTAGASKAEGTGSVNNVFGSFEDGVEFPSADSTIESYVEYAESNIGGSAVEDVNVCESSPPCDPGAGDPQVYYNNTDYTMNGEEFNVNSGNITVVVDGDLTIDNMDLTNAGSNTNLKIVTTGDLELTRGYTVTNSEGAGKLIFQTTSNGEVSFEGGSGTGTGTVYAPDSLVSLSEMGNGAGSDWTGPVVAEVFDAGGVDSDASITFSGSVDVQPADTEVNLFVLEREVGIE
jgi:hypothetical protein